MTLYMELNFINITKLGPSIQTPLMEEIGPYMYTLSMTETGRDKN